MSTDNKVKICKTSSHDPYCKKRTGHKENSTKNAHQSKNLENNSREQSNKQKDVKQLKNIHDIYRYNSGRKKYWKGHLERMGDNKLTKDKTQKASGKRSQRRLTPERMLGIRGTITCKKKLTL